MNFRKIKSHLTQEQVSYGCARQWDFELNVSADQLADEAADQVALPPEDLELIMKTDKRAWVVQKRIIAAHEIACSGDRPQIPRGARTGRPKPVSLADKFEDLRRLGHEVIATESTQIKRKAKGGFERGR